MMAATPLYWDPAGAATATGGTGTWNTTAPQWRSGSATGTLVAWSNAGDANGPYQAVFPGSAGTVTIGVGVTASSVSFAASGYALSGGNALTLAGGTGQLDVASGGTATISASVAGTVGLTKASAGLLALTGTNTYSGGTRIAAGTLRVASDASLGAVPASTATNVTFSGTGSLQAGAASVSLAAQRGISIPAGVTATLDTQSNTLTVNGPVSNAASTGVLAKGGTAGMLVLAGSNSFVAGTTVNMGGGNNVGAGTVELTNSGALGSNAITVDAHNVMNTAAATLMLAGGVTIGSNVTYLVGGHQPGYNVDLDSIGGNNVFNGTFNINNTGGNYAIQSTSGTLTVGGPVTVGFTPSSARLLTFQGAGAGVIAGVISGNIAPTFAGPGTWTVNNGETYTGPTTVSGGTLSLNVNQPLYGTLYGTQAGGAITVASGGTLLANNYNALTGYGNSNTTVTVNAGGTLANRPGFTNHIVNLTLAGGTLAGSPGSVNFGGFDVQVNSVINVTASSTISTIALTMEPGSSFNVAANATLSLTGSIANSAATAGVQLLKNGSGTMVVAGSSTYTGTTSINAGTLRVDGAIGTGAVSVASGATLSGVGTVPGAVTVASGGTLAPGDPTVTGILSTGPLTLQQGATLAAALNGPAAGTGYDQVNVTGNVALGNATLSLTGSRPPQGGNALVVVKTANTAQSTGTFNGLAQGSTLTVGGIPYVVKYQGGSNGTGSGGSFTLVDASPPAVSIAGAATVAEGAPYTLGLSAQASGSRTVTSWTVAWGDGSSQVIPGNPSSVSHVYANAATSRTITASATDSAGTYAASSAVTVAVTNVAPTVAWSGVTSVIAGATFQRKVATFTDPGFSSAQTYAATINWGDGTPTGAGTVAVTPGSAGRPTTGTVSGQHAYGAAGGFTVTVTVSDSNGGATTITQAVTADLPPQPYLIPGTPGSSTTVSFTVTNNVFSALYRNELGCYLVDDANYDIGSVGPKSAGYATAAVGGPSSRIVFPRGSAVGTTVSLVLPAGKLLAFYMVQDATTANFLNGTFPADFGRAAHWLEYKDRPDVFFLTPDANFDHFQHVRVTQVGSNPPVYGFEDLAGGGDQDFNDLVFSVGATAAPALTATANDAAGKIDLSWVDVPGERNGFQVYRGTSSGDLRPLGTTGRGMTTFSDYGAVPGQTYFYAVAAFANDMQPSAMSTPAQATLRAGAGTGPAVATTPGPLVYLGGTGPATVDAGLTVTDGSGHQIVGATVTVAGPASGGATLALPAGGPSGITAVWSASTGVLTLSGTASVADYQLALRAVTLAATTGASDVVTFAVTDDALLSAQASRTVAVSGPPTATATADEAAAAIDLSWTAVPGATAYQVYRGTTAGALSAYGAPVQIAPPYSDAGVTRGTTYYYAVAAVYNGQVGTASQPVHATLQPAGGPAVTTTVDPVSYLGGGTAVTVDGGVAVSDSAGRQLLGATVSVDNDADGSVVLALPPGGPAGITASWAAGTLTLSGTASAADYQAALRTVTLAGGPITATHQVTFTVTDAAPLSAQGSRAVNVYGPPTLAARPDLAAAAIDLTWNEVAAEHGFEVYRGTTAGGLAPYTSRGEGVTSYADTGAVAGTTYYYAVAALGADGLPAAQSSPPVMAVLPLPVAGGPVVTNTAGPLAYVGGSDAVAIDVGLAVSDGGGRQIVGASVWVTNDPDASDVLALPTAGRPNGITAVWSGGTLTLSGTASATDYQVALRSVTFWGTTAAPQTVGFSVTDAAGLVGQGARTVNVSGAPALSASADAAAGTIDLAWATVAGGQGFQLYRGTTTGGLLPYRTFGATTVAYADPNVVPGTTYFYAVAAKGPDGTAGLRSVMVNATLPIPVTTGPSLTTTAATLAYLDGALAVAADDGITLSDGAGIAITGATVRVTEDVAGSFALALPSGAPAGITASWSASNGVLTLSGTASVADYQVALRSVTFAATLAGPQTVTFAVTDSTSASAHGDRSVNVAGPTTVTATADEAAAAIGLSWTAVPVPPPTRSTAGRPAGAPSRPTARPCR